MKTRDPGNEVGSYREQHQLVFRISFEPATSRFRVKRSSHSTVGALSGGGGGGGVVGKSGGASSTELTKPINWISNALHRSSTPLNTVTAKENFISNSLQNNCNT